MPGELDSGESLHPTKSGQRSRILIKLIFGELTESKFSGLSVFDYMATWGKNQGLTKSALYMLFT